MDDVARGRGLLLSEASRSARRGRSALPLAVVPLGLAALACGPRLPGGAIGVSGGGKSEAHAGADGGAAPVQPRSNEIPADFRATFTRMNRARYVSNGHAAGRYDVDVYANALAKEPLVAERGEVPVGARVIVEHFERAGATHAGPLMMMEKREKGFDPERGDWRYVVVGTGGELVKDGIIESCAGCHGDAPHDHLFRVLE
jgi:hypothetical protein